jgi:hypothetical protein
VGNRDLMKFWFTIPDIFLKMRLRQLRGGTKIATSKPLSLDSDQENKCGVVTLSHSFANRDILSHSEFRNVSDRKDKMDAREAIKQTLRTTNMVVSSYLSDLSDADIMVRPGEGCNHIAWQLGHLIVSNAGILDSVVPGAAPALPAGFAERHGKDQAKSDDPSGFVSKTEYETLLAQVDAAVMSALDGMTDSDLDKPSPEHWRNMFPRVGDVMVLLATHSLMHAGQWVPVRRSLGKPVLI